LDQANLRYDNLIESHLEHLQREYRHQLIDEATLPQFWFLTVTFVPVETKRDDPIPIPPHRCFAFFERFYVRLLSRLMNNFERKRWLQPLTFLYIDYPFTKHEKTYATPLQTHDDLRHAIFYSSKLLKRPPRSLRDIDLYTVLPKAKSEPVYVKSDWERELEAALRESRAMAS